MRAPLTRVILAGCLLVTSVARAQPPDASHSWRPSAYSGYEYDYVGGPIAPNGHLEERRHEALVRGGAMALLASWGLSLVTASIADLVCNGSCNDYAYDLLYLPVAGPAIAAALPGVQQRSDAAGLTVLLVADTVIQTGAVVAILVGMLWHEKVVVVGSSPGGASFGLRF